MYYYNKPKLIEPKILKYLINKNQINDVSNNNDNNYYYNICFKIYDIICIIYKYLFIICEANYFFLLIFLISLILLYIRYLDVTKKRNKIIK